MVAESTRRLDLDLRLLLAEVYLNTGEAPKAIAMLRGFDNTHPEMALQLGTALYQTGANELWKNLGAGRFENITQGAGVAVADRISMSASFADIDNDGDPDLFVTTVKMGNLLFENDGGGRFRDVSASSGLDYVGHSSAATFFDVTADGWEDVLITSSMSFPFRYGINSMLINDRGERFYDAEFALGIEPRRDGRTRKPWFDLDCSGADAEHHLCNDKDGPWTVTGTLGTRSSALLDVDGDGDQDIVTLEFNAEPQVLLSNLAERVDVHFLEIELEGTRSNRDGLGALIRVHSGDRVLTRLNDGKSGYLAQSSLPVYVGLGENDWVDRIEVHWPSGQDQTVTENIVLNGRTRILEPE